MRVYLAGRYSRRAELREYAVLLASLGLEVTSRWLLGSHDTDGRSLSPEEYRAERARWAAEDLEDLRAADLVVCFTEAPRAAPPGRGGRHVEYGYALALGKPVAVVGPVENVFYCLPDVDRYEAWPDFLDAYPAIRAAAARA